MSNAPVQNAILSDANAERPSEFGWRVWWRVVRRVFAQADERNLGLISAGVAFYALLSIFPALAAIIALWGYVADPVMIGEQMDIARQLLPEDAFAILNDQVSALVTANNSTLQLTSLLSLVLAVWTARNGIAALIRGLNSIYRARHRSNPLRRYVVAILLTVLLILVAVFAFASVVILPALLGFLAVPALTEAVISLLKWAVVLLVVFFGICLLYRYGPNRRGARVPWLTSGAFLALFLWAAGSAAFSVYLRNFGSFNEVYGSLGAVVALLFWLYLSAYVVLLGAQMNAELELSTTRDSTIGDPAPAGQRQAWVADHVLDEDGNPHLASTAHSADAGPTEDPPIEPDKKLRL
ncbi:YihY/virulence factor BrkB family protein [Roseovarius pelagicus]|uniref:YihY/virulence factor BrkB family protein n=1 Tax=Roseovarius pelagicus TaxID=2980108 RepID=A0ABY6DGM4_9RHOB|nr:YihY/virulence factor BrkB family protein [Roseovarius pelagicus]UXX84103.1 YihY/virulence factor BrkB family protein [Roseovarius pelagicus]